MATVNNLTALSQDAFLQLLTAQLKNQDPLNPLSDTDMVGQLSQVSTLNGVNQLNATFSQMLQLQQLTQGTSLIGKTVDYKAGQGAASGVVSAVSATNGEISLRIGDRAVSLSDVTGVR